MAEPKSHVSEKQFAVSIRTAKGHGFEIIDKPQIRGTRVALLQKQQQ